MVRGRIRADEMGMPLDENIRLLVKHKATLFVSKIQGCYEDEHKLARLFGRYGTVLAVTLRIRLGKLSYALVTFAEASQSDSMVALSHSSSSLKRAQTAASLSRTSSRMMSASFTIPEARNLVCIPVDVDTLEESQGVMRQCIHQHAEQVVLAQQTAVSEVAMCSTRPVFKLAVLGNIVAVGSSDATVCALNISSGRPDKWQLSKHTGSLRAMCGCSGPCCSYGVLFTAACDGTVRGTSLKNTVESVPAGDRDGSIPWCYSGHTAGVTSLCHHRLPDDKGKARALLFSGSWDHSVCALDTMTGVPRWRYSPRLLSNIREQSEMQLLVPDSSVHKSSLRSTRLRLRSAAISTVTVSRWQHAGNSEQDSDPGVICIATSTIGTKASDTNVVLVGTSAGIIHALHASNGKKREHQFNAYVSKHQGGIVSIVLTL